jgi:hypothetical protein
LIDRHEVAAGVERLFRPLLALATAAVLEGLDGIAGPTVTVLSLGRKECMSCGLAERGLGCSCV